MERAKTITIIILLLGLLLSIGYTFYLHKNSEPPDATKIALNDTITVYNNVQDTIILEKLKYVTLYDTVVIRNIAVNDSVHQEISDTIHIPIDHKTAEFTINKDSLNLHQIIYYQGFKAQIDSITTDYSFNYTFKQAKQKKVGLTWCVGPYVGYGYQFNNGMYTHGIEVGIGVSVGIGGYIK